MYQKECWVRVFSLIALYIPFSECLSCNSCASKLLRSQWQATSLPIIPPNDRFHFDDKCNEKASETLKITCNSVCFEMLLVAGNEYTAVRGCLSDFYTGYHVPNLTPKCYYADYDQNLTIYENNNASKLDRVYVGTRYCTEENCNNELTATAEFAKTQTNWQSQKSCSLTETAQLPLYQCISCERFDSTGDCDAGYRNYCEGQWCTKTIGYVNGRWLETRGCAPINPSNNQMCVKFESSHEMSQLSSQQINFPYSMEQCFCTGQRCNGAIRMAKMTTAFAASTAMVAMIVLWVVPMMPIIHNC